MKNVLKAYFEVKKVLQNPQKNATNPFHKNKYADLSAHIDTITGPLLDLGLVYIQEPLQSENPSVIRLNCSLAHVESGEDMAHVFTMPIAKADAQGWGAGLTYARRYDINCFFGLYAADDDGNEASGLTKSKNKFNGKPNPPPIMYGETGEQITQAQQNRFQDFETMLINSRSLKEYTSTCHQIKEAEEGGLLNPAQLDDLRTIATDTKERLTIR